jgi:DUF4097 and DUF4098 domain-containing protein YvlB
MPRKLILPMTLIATLFCLAAASGGERRFEKKFTVSAGGTLKLMTDVGSVTVTGGSANEVAVLAELKGKQSDIDNFEVTAEQNSSGVDVRGRGEKSWFWKSYDIDVHYTITVPRSYNVRLQTSGGDMEVSAIQGNFEGKTSGGDIRAKDIEGKVGVETSGGSIHMESVTGDLKVSTSGGDIALDGLKGNVRAETSGGSVSVTNVQGKVEAETSGGNVDIKVTGPNMGVRARTSGGNVDIQIAKSVGANIDAGTSGGDVECDLPITVNGKISESQIRGTVNGGGELIYAHTSGGNVRIRALP